MCLAESHRYSWRASHRAGACIPALSHCLMFPLLPSGVQASLAHCTIPCKTITLLLSQFALAIPDHSIPLTRPFHSTPSPPASPEKAGDHVLPVAMQGSDPSCKTQHLKSQRGGPVLCANILIIHPDTPTSDSKHIQARLSHPTVISQQDFPCPTVPLAAKLSRDLLSDPTEQDRVTEV